MKIAISLIMLVCLSSCGFDKYNNLVADHNVTMLTAFGDAMAKQNSEGGRLAVSIMFGMRVGQQKFERPETALDYSKGFLPYADLFMRWYGVGSNKNSPTYHVEGANNDLFVTHEYDSRNSSTLYRDSMNTHSETYDMVGGSRDSYNE